MATPQPGGKPAAAPKGHDGAYTSRPNDKVTAVLGPTNTGKTHLAIERMLGHASGAIGLPLRLLAREVYNRIVQRAGVGRVALITGEEKILPELARYFVCTVEAMPRDLNVAFVAIDEVQLAGDLERGHIFTDRILHVRGKEETMLLGSAIAKPLIERLIPGVQVTSRPRMSQLNWAGQKKITRLPPRSAIVAFSAQEVYAIAELIRRQRGGAAVVMGSLSPRTRNAQVAMFQNGDVEHLVATDAIGMGLNLDVGHVAFAQDRKFDGYQFRPLNAAEIGQIAGRAGRHLNDGTFGVTGQVDPFDEELVQQLEAHEFESLKCFQWRNADLDFASIEALHTSLDALPRREGLARALPADDLRALEFASRDDFVLSSATKKSRIQLLWDVCQIPDFRKVSPAAHGELIVTVYEHLERKGRLDESWFASQVTAADQTVGDLDMLSRRITQIRTWTFIANRQNWLADPAYWQGKTREVEDRLSDALHVQLTQRFVDRRTSVLMKRLRENAMLEAEITSTGEVRVEGQLVGELHGFRFQPAESGDGPEAKAMRAAAAKALAGEIEKRADRLYKAPDADIVLSHDGILRWLGEPVGKLLEGENALKPRILLLADEQLTGPARDRAGNRLELWMNTHITALLKPLHDLGTAQDLEGLARGVAFRMIEALGTLERSEVAEDVKGLDQAARAVLRKYGVRFGAYHIYIPALLKPAPATLIAMLWALKNASLDMPGLAELPALSQSGRTSIPVDVNISKQLYRLVGFRVAGPRAVRLDILERLADIIRPLVAWKPTEGAVPPDGAVVEGGAFTVTVSMTSLLGCAGEDFANVLKGLGYRVERRTVKVLVPAKPEEIEVVEDTAEEISAEAVEVIETADVAVEDAAPSEDATPASEPSDAAADEGVAAEVETADADAAEPSIDMVEEERIIEVWRPGRFERGPRQEGQRDGQANRGNRGPRSFQPRDGQAQGDRPQGDRPQGDRPQGDRPQRSFQGQPSNREGGKDRFERRFDGAAPRGGANGNQGQRNESGQNNAVKKERRDKPVDPTSPFAALAALKADLEERAKKK